MVTNERELRLTIDMIEFDEKGLVPVIVQDVKTNAILMFAWMNRESLEKTIDTGIMTFWSRSRQKLWIKGETSGNIQELREMYVDCDADCILCKVVPKGAGAACHLGYYSCFYRKLDEGRKTFEIIAKRRFDPDAVYKKQ